MKIIRNYKNGPSRFVKVLMWSYKNYKKCISKIKNSVNVINIRIGVTQENIDKLENISEK